MEKIELTEAKRKDLRYHGYNTKTGKKLHKQVKNLIEKEYGNVLNFDGYVSGKGYFALYCTVRNNSSIDLNGIEWIRDKIGSIMVNFQKDNGQTEIRFIF